MSQTLVERIGVDPYRPKVVEDCVHLIDGQVKAKGGLSGMAIKGAYATVKAIKPGFVAGVIDALFDAWVAKLEPYYGSWRSVSTSLRKPSGKRTVMANRRSPSAG